MSTGMSALRGPWRERERSAQINSGSTETRNGNSFSSLPNARGSAGCRACGGQSVKTRTSDGSAANSTSLPRLTLLFGVLHMTPKPAKVVSEYSPEELARFRDSFGPSVNQYRRRERTVAIAGAVPIVLFLMAFVLGQAFTGFKELSRLIVPLVVVFLICWVVLIFVGLAMGNLKCPACGNQLNGRFGPYCPECGKAEIKRGAWLQADRCLACGKVLQRGKGSSVRIR